MKIVIIEDDINKSRQVSDFVRRAVSDLTLIERRSYTSGLRIIRETLPDLVLLDMSIPNYDASPAGDGGKFRSYGGRDILQQIARRQLPTRVIVVTQYSSFSDEGVSLSLNELSQELSRDFPINYIETVYYNAAEDAWKDRLTKLLSRIEDLA